MQSRTPKMTNGIVQEFCRSIVAGTSPIYLSIQPDKDAIANECFQNVQRKVEREGGEVCLGWNIWEWPRVWIEAEFHAVWRSSDKSVMLDITPEKPEQNSQRLFLHDPNATYDFGNLGFRVDNRRKPLGSDWRIKRCLELAKRENGIKNLIPGLGEVVIPKHLRAEFLTIQNERQALTFELIERFTGPNDPCPCGSGKKLKKCHVSPKRTI